MATTQLLLIFNKKNTTLIRTTQPININSPSAIIFSSRTPT